MNTWGWIAAGYLGFLVVAGSVAVAIYMRERWLDRRDSRTYDERFGRKHGIDVNTTYPHFLPGERLP